MKFDEHSRIWLLLRVTTDRFRQLYYNCPDQRVAGTTTAVKKEECLLIEHQLANETAGETIDTFEQQLNMRFFVEGAKFAATRRPTVTLQTARKVQETSSFLRVEYATNR